MSILLSALMTASADDAVIPPNILLVVSDDQGYGDATCYGESNLSTPVMDGIARRGIRFERFRVNPLCAPTRSSIMTGLYSLENGMWRGPGQLSQQPMPADGWPPTVRRIRDDVRLLPEYLNEAGYATGIFGKWHLGYDPVNTPDARGFEEFIGFLGGAHPYWIGRNSRFVAHGTSLPTTGHATDIFADAAIEFIRDHRNQPFFCYVPFNAVHGPLRNAERDSNSATEDWLATYAARGIEEPRRDYNAVMSHADHRVGDILSTLRELDLEERTLVIFLSDNGALTDKYPGSNGPLRGGKGTTYEGGIRVPAVMQWPGVIPAGAVSRADAVHFDLFATILDAAGVAIPEQNGPFHVHGESLMEHLRSGCLQPLPDRYVFWDLFGKQATLHGEWKLVGESVNHHGDFLKAVETSESTVYELYNLDDDLGESRDLATAHPEIYRDLKERYVEWLRQFVR